jgi:hypothetical protein
LWRAIAALVNVTTFSGFAMICPLKILHLYMQWHCQFKFLNEKNGQLHIYTLQQECQKCFQLFSVPCSNGS